METTGANPAPHRPVTLDDVDYKILKALLDDARQSIRAIARTLGMSPGAVSDRMTRLEGEGVLRGYHADVDQEALGYGLRALIGARIQADTRPLEFVERLMEIPEVEGVRVVAGQWDLFLDIVARDHVHLKDVVLTKIWGMQGFTYWETMIVYESRTRWPQGNVALALREND